MSTPAVLRRLGAIAACAAVLFAPTLVLTQDQPDAGQKAMWARQGFMNLVSWTAGPLFGMAKGDVAYDAEVAKANAANLQVLYQYPFPELFLPGTSKADRPGKTRALPDIWSDQAKFQQAFENLRAAVATVAAEVGKGQAELAAAVSEMGKGCGDCHKAFRAKDY